MEFTETDLKIKAELEMYVKINQPEGLFLSAIIGSWKETQTDEQILEMLKEINREQLLLSQTT